MEKYFFFDGEPGWSGFKIIEFAGHEHDAMIDKVREFHERHERLPTVFYGTRLSFEPAEIIKSWKIQEDESE